jgi:hypothetical protein
MEELHVSHDIYVYDLEALVLSRAYTFPKSHVSLDSAQEPSQVEPRNIISNADLRLLARSVLICKLMQRVKRIMLHPSDSTNELSSANVLFEKMSNSNLRYLDLSDICRTQILNILDSVLLAEESRPLKVIELGPSMLDWCDVGVKQLFRSEGWTPRCVGKRSWLERK